MIGRSRPHERRTIEAHDTKDRSCAFPPLTHVALTVRDLAVSVPWYEALLDAEPVIDEDTDPDMHHTVYLLGNGTLLGLHQHEHAGARRARSASSASVSTTSRSAAPTAPSSRSGPRRLDELGIEHGGIKDAPYGSGLSFRDPDGIALEFFAPPARPEPASRAR